MKNFLKILFSKYHDKKQYNTLENNYEALVHSMQSEAWEKILIKLDEDSTTKRIKTENKSLRKEKKEWKERALKAEEKLKKANL